MPLFEIDAATALETYKGNATAKWPLRGGENRLTPIAKPRLQPSFTLEPGETIFTIGSCFARNVERELGARGFVLPAIEVIKADPDFATVGTDILNNYGTPSIFNEIHWALERDYRPEECFYPVGDKWVDMHLRSELRPKDRETVENRRAAITAAYRKIPECRVIIITLGLSEVWFDKETGTYLNAPPRRGMLRSTPERFALHILSHAEAHGFLHKAMQLIKAHGRDDVRVVMTVSPVPLTATYRDMDVMEANCYSKSVLRAVAEQIRSEFDFVDYYPSYESITLSERSVAWREDETHVTHEIVGVNIGRMVAAYSDSEEVTADYLRDKIATLKPGPLFMLLTDHTDLLDTPDLAAAYAEAAINTGHFDIAAKWIDKADDDTGFLAASVALHEGKEAVSLFKSPPVNRNARSRYYRTKITAHIRAGDRPGADETLQEWTAFTGRNFEPYRAMASALREQGSDDAERFYEKAMEMSHGHPRVRLDYAECLVEQGRRDEARELAEPVKIDSAATRRRVERIMEAV
jgi:tetratricopeptide (TPR) repeat protein